MLNSTYADVTDATEEFIRQLFVVDDPITPSEIRIREEIAKAALGAWFSHTAPLATEEIHIAEHDRLGELVHELPLAVLAVE